MYCALIHGPKTMPEIDAWALIPGQRFEKERNRKIGRALGNLQGLGLVERTSYRRPSPLTGLPNRVYRCIDRTAILSAIGWMQARDRAANWYRRP